VYRDVVGGTEDAVEVSRNDHPGMVVDKVPALGSAPLGSC
jgi:hypothetical protein